MKVQMKQSSLYKDSTKNIPSYNIPHENALNKFHLSQKRIIMFNEALLHGYKNSWPPCLNDSDHKENVYTLLKAMPLQAIKDELKSRHDQLPNFLSNLLRLIERQPQNVKKILTSKYRDVETEKNKQNDTLTSKAKFALIQWVNESLANCSKPGPEGLPNVSSCVHFIADHLHELEQKTREEFLCWNEVHDILYEVRELRNTLVEAGELLPMVKSAPVQACDNVQEISSSSSSMPKSLYSLECQKKMEVRKYLLPYISLEASLSPRIAAALSDLLLWLPHLQQYWEPSVNVQSNCAEMLQPLSHYYRQKIVRYGRK